ncbi:hypothetical protein EGW08_012879 [Elysia chlorotica]|uniref:Uncharacterized protein n=1 Tax=Elysia chlorotica TaxID=188477 RepID=A0A433TCQ8_ELYCH|nr:hypothetical protein EGW08_012879 [Elysia chlorotica]
MTISSERMPWFPSLQECQVSRTLPISTGLLTWRAASNPRVTHSVTCTAAPGSLYKIRDRATRAAPCWALVISGIYRIIPGIYRIMGDGASRVDRGNFAGEPLDTAKSIECYRSILSASSCKCHSPTCEGNKLFTAGCPRTTTRYKWRKAREIRPDNSANCGIFLNTQIVINEANRQSRLFKLPVDSECFRLSKRLRCVSLTHAGLVLGSARAHEGNQLTRMRHDSYFGAGSLELLRLLPLSLPVRMIAHPGTGTQGNSWCHVKRW